MHPCNFIFVSPPSVEEMSNRLIRCCDVDESKESIAVKQSRMRQDLAMVKALEWISKSFVSDAPGKVEKEAPLWIVHDLYKFFSGPSL